MARYGFIIDVEKCTGCHSCFLACKDEYVGNDYLPVSAAQPDLGHNWINLVEVEHGSGSKIKVDYIPIMCQHCQDAPCILSDNEGAVYRRGDGIVIIDPEKAKGRMKIVDACPYKAIYWNQDKNLPQKCTMCAHLLDNGEKTVRCAESCPTGALIFGNLDDPDSRIARVLADKADRLECLKPEFATRPIIKYIDLPKPFIAGEVVLADRQHECAEGVKVTLKSLDDDKTLETTTDCFGDFEFRSLEKNKDYVVRVEYGGYQPVELTVRTKKSLNVGEVILRTK